MKNSACFAGIMLVFSLLFTGCIGDQGTFNNLDISGYVRSSSDSVAVPGALLLVSIGISQMNCYSDSLGYYHYHRTVSTGDGDPLSVVLTVVDVDGEMNGVFISRDTLLYEEDTEGIVNIEFQVDILVEMIQ